MSATAPELFAASADEDWLASRLSQLHARLDVNFCGSRKDLLKHVIEQQGFEMIIAGRREDGRPETFSEAWERVYGEAFRVKQTHTRGG